MKNTKRPKGCTVEFYEGGVALNTPRGNHKGNPIPPNRGKITGWSKASRRRMREYMLTHEARDVWFIGTTYTIPGPVLPAAALKALWTHWCREAQRKGWSSIWRLEVQQRQQVHWHCLLMIPKDDPVCLGNRLKARNEAVWSWHEALDWLGPRKFDPPYKATSGAEYVSASSLMALPGAFSHAADCKVDDTDKGAWRRYLQDHASKTKQEQIAQDVGRHWGVVGRSRLLDIDPDEVVELSTRRYYRFLRQYQRMCTPRFKDDRAPFGRRLGFRSHRGSIGRSIWYSRPESVRRLIEWAQSGESSKGPELAPDHEPKWVHSFAAP